MRAYACPSDIAEERLSIAERDVAEKKRYQDNAMYFSTSASMTDVKFAHTRLCPSISQCNVGGDLLLEV